MPNPFTFHKHPATPAEHQANANWATYERMAACEELANFDRHNVQAPADVIANAHTSKWVEKEYARKARQAHAGAK